MKSKKNQKWGEMTKIARSLKLTGKQGIYFTRDNRKVDLTATAPNRNSVLHTIALQLI